MPQRSFSIEDGNLQSRSVISTKQRVYKDLDLTFARAANNDVFKKTDAAAVKQAVKNLLLTRKGERPFQPLFGTMVPSFLFENITTKLLDKLKQGLQKDIEFWLPYINMEEIIVEDLREENRINISFSFSVGESGANQIIILNVDEQGSLSIA